MNNYEKMNILRKKQNAFMKQVQEELFLDNTLRRNEIYRFFYLSQFGQSLEIYVFYINNELLWRDLENGTTEKIKTIILQKLNKLGYFNEFSNNVLFEFDSHENVKKKYKGNYFLRLR